MNASLTKSQMLRMVARTLGMVVGACAISAITSVPLRADDELFGDDSADTATGDVLESAGDLSRGLGKGSLLKSLSAKQLQMAIDRRLDNREERVETYYELRDLREKEVGNEATITSEVADKIASARAPERLTDKQFDAETGEIFWPRPLDDKLLKPYRRPIEETLAKRSSPGEDYGKFDYFKVQRMINLLREAIDSIDNKLDTREVVALKEYLGQIAYEARFDASDERVDY